MNEFDHPSFLSLLKQQGQTRKIQAGKGIQTLTSVMPVQCLTS